MASNKSFNSYPLVDVGQGLKIPDFSKIPRKDWQKVVNDLNKKEAKRYKNLPTQVLSSPNANLRAGIDYRAPEKIDTDKKKELAKKFADSKRKETMMMVEAAALPFTFSGLPIKAAGKQLLNQGDNMLNLIRKLAQVKSGASKVPKTKPKTMAPPPKLSKGGVKPEAKPDAKPKAKRGRRPQGTLTEIEKIAKQKGVTKQEAAVGSSKSIKNLRLKKEQELKIKKQEAKEAADKAKSLGDPKPQAPTKKATNEQINKARMAEYEKKRKEVQKVRKQIDAENKYNAKLLDKATKEYKEKTLPKYKKDLAAYNKRKADMDAYKQAVKKDRADGMLPKMAGAGIKKPPAVGKPPVKPKPPALGSREKPDFPRKPDLLPETPKAKPKEVTTQNVKPQEGRPQTPINEGKQPTKQGDKEDIGGLTQKQIDDFFPPAPLREATEEVAEGVGKRSFNPATNEGFGNIAKEVGEGAAKVGGKVKEGTKAASDVAFKKVLPTTVVLGGGGLGATGYMLGRGGDDKTPKPKEIESNKQQGKEPSDTVVIGTTDAKQTIDTDIPLKDTELSKKRKNQSTGGFLSAIRNVGRFADSLANKGAYASGFASGLDKSRFVFTKPEGGRDGDVAGGGAGGAAGAGAGGGGTGMSFQEAMRIANETKEREMLQNLEGTTPTGLDYLRSAPEVEAQNVVRRQLMERQRNKRKQRVA